MAVVEVLTQKGKLVDDFLLKMLRLGSSNELYEIVEHQVTAGGKRLRPAMTILCCEAVGGSVKNAIPAAASIELVHNYTLIFDDIIDRSELRRGLPTVRAKYGDVMAILAGMHYREAIFEAVKRGPKSNEVEEILSAALRRIIEGERLDVLFEQAGRESEYIQKMTYRTIMEKDYNNMIAAKTASLFEAACKVGSIVGNGNSHFVRCLSKCGWNCGIAFQIRDDILDIVGETEELGKEAGKDVKEHKFGNLVILYSLAGLTETSKNRLLAILRSQHISNSDVDKAIEIILSTNAVKLAYEKSKTFIKRAKSSIETLPPSKAKSNLLNLADLIIQRKF